jgi:AraC-like DNA-binding protein
VRRLEEADVTVKSRRKVSRAVAVGSSPNDELAARITGWLPRDGAVEAAPGLFLSRFSSPTGPLHRTIEPSFCVVAQGSKLMLLGREQFRYDPRTYLLISSGVPLIGHITRASADRPCLGVRVRLEPELITSVLIEAGFPESRAGSSARALSVSGLDAGLSDAVLRLVRVAESPRDYRVLAPLIVREIVYRLAQGDQRGRLAQLAVSRGHTHRMAKAIELLRKGYDKPLRIESLARQLGMSVSGLHHHFKQVTAMSPLQFQKQLRLQEARRLLLAGEYDAATAGFQVGYQDPAYFSREYKRLFGEPPIRDVERLRGPARSVSGAPE